ncbi:hypothetical protein CL614_00560 [archaeon]|nr:hypothetical protein [archaeon]
MKKFVLILSVLVTLVIISGCTEQSGSSKGLTISMKASPPEIFTGADTAIQVDIENLGTKTFRDVQVYLYDIGNLEFPYSRDLTLPKPGLPARGSNNYCQQKIAQGFGKCTEGEGDCDDLFGLTESECASGLACKTIGTSIWDRLVGSISRADICCDPADEELCAEKFKTWKLGDDHVSSEEVRFYEGFESCSYSNEKIRPNAFDSYMCRIHAPKSIIGDEETEFVRTKALFVTDFSIPVIASIINENEYQRRKAVNDLPSSPRSFTEDDGNMQIKVSFSADMPIVDRVSEEEYMYIDITNVGEGYLDEIRPQDIRIWDSSADEKDILGNAREVTPVDDEEEGFLDMILGRRTGQIVDSVKDRVGDLVDTDSGIVDSIQNLFDLDTVKDKIKFSKIGHEETGCIFDYQCKGDLECKSVSYLSISDNVCCKANENAVSDKTTKKVSCKTKAEQNPYVVDLASEIIQPGRCDIDDAGSPLKPIGDGKRFPRITCRLKLPNDVPFITNHVIIVTVGYEYELRQSTPVTIIR